MAMHWKQEPEDHDFPAALSYLSLVFENDRAQEMVRQLKSASTNHYKAKDLLRASKLKLLAESNAHVASDLHKVSRGKKLSPVLLVRGDAARGIPLIIADGYHRVCASYWLDENTDIPCRIVDSWDNENSSDKGIGF